LRFALAGAVKKQKTSLPALNRARLFAVKAYY